MESTVSVEWQGLLKVRNIVLGSLSVVVSNQELDIDDVIDTSSEALLHHTQNSSVRNIFVNARIITVKKNCSMS